MVSGLQYKIQSWFQYANVFFFEQILIKTDLAFVRSQLKPIEVFQSHG